jgi:hypothetical protein
MQKTSDHEFPSNLDGYVLEQPLGKGAQGFVVPASVKESGERVALNPTFSTDIGKEIF